MKRKNIRKELQVRIKRYLEYIWNNDNIMVESASLLGVLSHSLRDEVLSEINGNIMK